MMITKLKELFTTVIIVISHGESAYHQTEEYPQSKEPLPYQLLSVNGQHLFLIPDLLYKINDGIILYESTIQLTFKQHFYTMERIVFVFNTFTNSAGSRPWFHDILVTHSSPTHVARSAFLKISHTRDSQIFACFFAFIYGQHRSSSFALLRQNISCATIALKCECRFIQRNIVFLYYFKVSLQHVKG